MEIKLILNGKTITDEQAKAWKSVYQQVKNSGFPLLSFSDNPYSDIKQFV